MITISFVRHGESTDNLRSIWAGWKDAPLSNHGMNQARACGDHFSSIRITAIYTSPLNRAHTTAKAIFDAQIEPRPSFTVSPDLREQHFGIAEGEPWVVSSDSGIDIERKIFPTLHGRVEKFPDGESLNDLQERAARAVEKLILPWVWDTKTSYGKAEGEVHLVVVSHGLCISELVSALVRRDVDGYGIGKDYRGLMNTAWTRVTVAVKDEHVLPAPTPGDKSTPLTIRITHLNQYEHLANVKRQKGGIGSSSYDPNQKKIKDFFSGASAS